ncbi:MBL fold metallo-hydrolase [Bacillus sp. FJAT-42376]|uniref:MBL fold metallo-hydrolase n=1 Tax=Bacillus sp. FJAT-42376 TaxID=2014076 RepID=UPI000F513CF8|nr:MBL fold metallo-hydrolase [Bacillus sp. FJAT-42376]AZB42629.1 MBL fold metallo-hydrolase [Bacillus sp. FJAT-42376]
MGTVKRLSNRISMIDTFDLRKKGRTSAYVLHEDMLTLLEPSASPSVPYIKSGMAELGLSVKDIQYIIVTHVHLDHAGGAGLLLKECPNAKVVVHPKGARHLVNPERLTAGAKAVYKEHFDELFDPVLPVPEERILTMKDKDRLAISEKCVLEFIDSPGHANHHFSIFEPISKGIFTGDAAGIAYADEQFSRFCLPSASPNQFDPEAMLRTAEKLQSLQPDVFYFSHFGPHDNPAEALEDMRQFLPVFLEAAEKAIRKTEGMPPAVQWKETEAELKNRVFPKLTDKNIPKHHPVYDILNLDLAVSAMGLVHYFQTSGKGKK